MDDIRALCDVVRQTAYAIHKYHGNGHLEKVYENALVHRLRKLSFEVVQQHPLSVADEDGTILGEYLADLLINRVLIVELKVARAIAPEHEAQVLAYLRGAHLQHALLINFGSARFEFENLRYKLPCRSAMLKAATVAISNSEFL
jgi:GxxExxY protein